MNLDAIPPLLQPDELEALLRERADVRVLDVRTAGEYEAVHIRGAYNVPLGILGEHTEEVRATENVPVVLVCQSGARAGRAEQALAAAGMPHLHVLQGGMNAWIAAGQPVERGVPRLSLERQVRIVAGALAAAGGLLALVVNPLFALIPLVIGSGLVFAGVTDTCGMAMLLARLPYNRGATCDVDAMIRALQVGSHPDRSERASTAPVR